ncbi:MAG: class I SAM-dependent methyltransferase [Candidatus Nanoarchaeia archaeon]|nr:class I SAM-dependent methyltransferase [Candidatus Jingweiarchaeum tengchongense]
MIIGKNEIKDYGWIESKTQAHDYLLPCIINSLNKLPVSKNDFILDAGCGGGYLMDRLNKFGYKNIFGFDISKSGIEIAKKNFKDISDNSVVHNAYEKILPEYFPDKFDLVISTEVIEHLYSPHDYLENINSWLKPKGFLILTTPYHGYFKNMSIALFNKFDEHFNPLWEGGHIKFFSKSTLSELLKSNGFEQIKFLGCGRIPYLWKSMMIIGEKV